MSLKQRALRTVSLIAIDQYASRPISVPEQQNPIVLSDLKIRSGLGKRHFMRVLNKKLAARSEKPIDPPVAAVE